MKRLVACTLAAFAATTILVGAQTNGVAERFTAMAVNMSQGASGTVEIAVNRWSTEAERTRLISTLMERGADTLLDVLEELPRVGYIRANGGLGYDLHYAQRLAGPDGGEHVVLVTNRRIGYWEAVNQPRSIDYPFTVIELRLNTDGEGEGKISLATKVTADPDSKIVTLENYDTQPVQLKSVRSEKISQ